MAINRYALLTEIANGQYEVFHIVRVIDDEPDSLDRFNRIENALNSGGVISGLAANERPGLLMESTWDGVNFTLPDPIPEYLIGTPFENGTTYKSIDNLLSFSAYVLLCDNKVFYMIGPAKGDYVDQKFEAAFSNPVTMKKIDQNSTVTIGYIWDGTTFNPPA